MNVSFAGQAKSAEAGADGKWTVKLDALPANEHPQTLEITAGTQKVQIEDVLVGEVWMCSGAEAWVRRETLEKDPRFASLIQSTLKNEAYNATEQAQTNYAAALEKHKAAVLKAKAPVTAEK